MKLTKPKKPIAYSRTNWPSPENYAQAMRIYEQAMAIYIALGGKQ